MTKIGLRVVIQNNFDNVMAATQDLIVFMALRKEMVLALDSGVFLVSVDSNSFIVYELILCKIQFKNEVRVVIDDILMLYQANLSKYCGVNHISRQVDEVALSLATHARSIALTKLG